MTDTTLAGQKGKRTPPYIEANTADRIFFWLFYACLGFLSGFVGMFGRTAFQVPFMVACVFVCFRFAMRRHCRHAILDQLKSNKFLALVCFSAVVLMYAIVGFYADVDRLRLFGKPVVIVLAIMLLAYVLECHREIDRQKIVSGFFYGILAGLTGVVLVSTWNWSLQSTFGQGAGLQPIPISVLSLNDELNILSVLVFFVAAGLSDRKRMYWACIFLPVTIWLISFWTYGADELVSGTRSITRTDSDVIQFGLPFVILVFFLTIYAPRLMSHLLFLGIAFLLAFAPWIFQLWYRIAESIALPRPMKFLVRGEIWDAVAKKSLESPIFGHGLDATRNFQGLKLENRYYIGHDVWHPHNMFIQIWIDMGLIGVGFGLLFCYLVWKFVTSIALVHRPAIVSGTLMYVFFALSTHSFWQTWCLVLLFSLCAYSALFLANDGRATD